MSPHLCETRQQLAVSHYHGSHKHMSQSVHVCVLVQYKSLFTKLVVAKKRKTYIHINTVKSNKTKQNTASKYANINMSSALEVLTTMRYINQRFTYLLAH